MKTEVSLQLFNFHTNWSSKKTPNSVMTLLMETIPCERSCEMLVVRWSPSQQTMQGEASEAGLHFSFI